MHLHILPEHQKLFVKKDIFYHLVWLKAFFLCICAYFQTTRNFFQKRYFWPSEKICFLLSGVVTNVYLCICAYLQTTRNFFSKEIFLNVWGCKKRVLMHLRILPDHQKLFFRKDIFYCLEWLKTCFDAFSHTSRPTETFYQKKYFWPSGEVKNVFWCIFANFHTTRNFFSEKIFITVWSG